MLRHTFCHIPGVGAASERRLWEAGVRSWEEALDAPQVLPRCAALRPWLETSRQRLDHADARYFAGALPACELWRLYPDFRGRTAFLDIETTGLSRFDHRITTIALYDGRRVRHYVQGVNLPQFADHIDDYTLIVTYNGKAFDVPFIRQQLGLPMDIAHVDLMHVLRSLGLRGGLKGVERTLGLARPGLEDVDGFLAVLLWHEYERRRDPRVLETLLAYNVQDVLTLQRLMVLACNRKLEATPFAAALRLDDPAVADNPFAPDPAVLGRLRPRWA